MNNGIKIFEAISYANNEYINSALDSMRPAHGTAVHRPVRTLLAAAVIAALLIALGAAAYAAGYLRSERIDSELEALRQLLEITETEERQRRDAAVHPAPERVEAAADADSESQEQLPHANYEIRAERQNCISARTSDQVDGKHNSVSSSNPHRKSPVGI